MKIIWFTEELLEAEISPAIETVVKGKASCLYTSRPCIMGRIEEHDRVRSMVEE